MGVLTLKALRSLSLEAEQFFNSVHLVFDELNIYSVFFKSSFCAELSMKMVIPKMSACSTKLSFTVIHYNLSLPLSELWVTLK